MEKDTQSMEIIEQIKGSIDKKQDMSILQYFGTFDGAILQVTATKYPKGNVFRVSATLGEKDISENLKKYLFKMM